MNNVVSLLEFSGIVCGGYIGYRYGNEIKKSILNQSEWTRNKYESHIKPTIDKNKLLKEDELYNVIASLGLGSIAYYYKAWWLLIPCFIVQIGNDYPKKFSRKSLTEKKDTVKNTVIDKVSKWWK